MQAFKSETINEYPAGPNRLTKRIGSTVFNVNFYPKESSSETLENKLLRLIKQDLEFGATQSTVKRQAAGHESPAIFSPDSSGDFLFGGDLCRN